MNRSIGLIGIYLLSLPVASPDARGTIHLAGVLSVIYRLLAMLISIVPAQESLNVVLADLRNKYETEV